jgi:putative heme-binding domain-containing protein
MPFYEPRDNPLTSRQQILIAGVTCLVISVLAAGAVSQSPPRKSNSDKTNSSAVGTPTAPTPDQARGRRLFEGHCARCHGMQGGGGTGANLRRPKLPHAADDDSLFDLIRSGIPGTGMPYTWAMADNEVRDVIAYVRSLGRIPSEPLPGDPDKGQLIYRKAGCSSCHIVAGKGGSLGPDLSDIGSRRGVEFLRGAMLHPGKDRILTSEGYDTYLPVLAATKDGRVLTGMRVNEDTFTIQLRDTNNRLYSLQKSDLEALDKLDGSVMPTYEKMLSRSDIDHVVSYLASLKQSGADEPKATGLNHDLQNSIGVKFALIPPGKFMMGSPNGERGRNKDEEQREVEITKEFHLSIHEVTQDQFEKVMGFNPSYFSARASGKKDTHYEAWSLPGGGKDKVKELGGTGEFPVENVSWYEAVEFCKKLAALPAEQVAGRTYRLPSEAEWEYACRGEASSTQVFHFGNSLSSEQANFRGTMPFGGAAKGPWLERTCKVGSNPPNAFGLSDMHGNVWEWCSDRYEYEGDRGFRVRRGGSWGEGGEQCRTAIRLRRAPDDHRWNLGFRVVMVPAR